MSERPKDWDSFSEDEILNSEIPGVDDADKFIDELLAEKSAPVQEDGSLWYDLRVGGSLEQPPEENAEAPAAEESELPPAEEELPVSEEPAPAAPEEERVPERAPRREKRARRPEPEPEVVMEKPVRPIRQRRHRRFGCLGGLMYFVFVVGISVIIASLGWLWATDLLALGAEDNPIEITLPETFFHDEVRDVTDDEGNVTGKETVRLADVDQVAEELKDLGLIEYKFLFKLFCSIANADEKMDPGTYMLSTKFDYYALISSMRQGVGELVIVEVTIPEGYTVDQIFRLLADNEVCGYEELVDAGANYEFDYEFLADLEYGAENRLEGFLFPDTYEFYKNEAPEEAIERLLDNFQRKFTSGMVTEGEMMGYSMREILTIASLIEKEAGKNAERATIASVIYNRLDSSDYPYLNIDATIQYVLPERKEDLTYADLEIDSPYNTYLYPGLPAGPIANPGLASIKAALNPEETNYYFYALNLEGGHNFFTNASDHDAFCDSDQYGG